MLKDYLAYFGVRTIEQLPQSPTFQNFIMSESMYLKNGVTFVSYFHSNYFYLIDSDDSAVGYKLSNGKLLPAAHGDIQHLPKGYQDSITPQVGAPSIDDDAAGYQR